MCRVMPACALAGMLAADLCMYVHALLCPRVCVCVCACVCVCVCVLVRADVHTFLAEAISFMENTVALRDGPASTFIISDPGLTFLLH